jgi:hypothetical protein
MFAIFCGLLILFDYIMNVLLIFPALCVYDRNLQANGVRRASCFMLCSCFGLLKNQDPRVNSTTSTKKLAEIDEDADTTNDDIEATTRTNGTSGRPSSPTTNQNAEDKPSLLVRILVMFYEFVHATRWPLLVASMAALGVCIYYASTLELPTSSDVRLLNDKEPFEQNYLWRQKLLNVALEKSSGSQANMFWGIKAADTGDHSTSFPCAFARFTFPLLIPSLTLPLARDR